MSRPSAKDLTQRELDVMHVFWKEGTLTAQDVRDHLAVGGLELTYTTVATLVRILHEKSFIKQLNDERPFTYAAAKSYEKVTSRLLGDVLDRVFGGSREQLLMRLFEQGQLTKQERAVLKTILEEEP